MYSGENMDFFYSILYFFSKELVHQQSFSEPENKIEAGSVTLDHFHISKNTHGPGIHISAKQYLFSGIYQCKAISSPGPCYFYIDYPVTLYCMLKTLVTYAVMWNLYTK